MQIRFCSWPPAWVSKCLCTTPSAVISHHVLETTPWFSSQQGVLSADLLEKLGLRLEAWKLMLKDQWTMGGSYKHKNGNLDAHQAPVLPLGWFINQHKPWPAILSGEEVVCYLLLWQGCKWWHGANMRN